MPKLQPAIGVSESEMLSEFLEIVARDYALELSKWRDHRAEAPKAQYLKRMADEARDWAQTVKPMPVGGWK